MNIKNFQNSLKEMWNENAGKFYFIISALSFIIVIGFYFAFIIKTNVTDIIIISIILLLILGTFYWNYFKYVETYIKIKKQLDDFCKNFENIKNIKEFTEKYEDIRENINNIEHFSDIWREFCETLIPIKEHNEIVKYKNTAQTESYINAETIINHQININLYNSLPGIFTGLGLVGTFTAITFALMGFNLNDLSGSVENLLGGLSVKFISSLAGIVTSIYFIFIKDFLYGKLNKTLLEAQQKLNRIFPRRTNESFLNDILIEIKEQSDQLKQFLLNMDFQDAIKKAMSLGMEDLKPEFTNIREAINYSIEEMQKSKVELFDKLDNINNNIATSLKTSIVESLSTLTSDFAMAIAELKLAMTDFKNTKQESSASLIQNMIDELKNCITNMQSSFTNAVVGGSGDTIMNLQKALVDASGYLSNTREMYSEFMNNMQQQMTKNSLERDESVNRVVNQTIEKLHNTNDTIQNSMNSQFEKMAEWISSINNYIAEMQHSESNVKTNYSALINEFNSAIDRQKEIIINNNQFINSLVNASNQLNGATNNMITAQQMVSRTMSDAKEANSTFVEQFKEFNSINSEMNNTLRENIRVIDGKNIVYENINNTATKIIETLTTNVNEFANKSIEYQNQVLTEFSQQISTQLGGLNAIIEQQKEIVDELNETIEESIRK